MWMPSLAHAEGVPTLKSPHDFGYVLVRDVEISGEARLGCPLLKARDHRADIGVADLRVALLRPSRRASLRVPVGIILGSCSKKQMGRVYARRLVAPVKDASICRDAADKEQPRRPVCPDRSCAPPHLAITLSRLPTSPEPAGVRLAYVQKESSGRILPRHADLQLGARAQAGARVDALSSAVSIVARFVDAPIVRLGYDDGHKPRLCDRDGVQAVDG
jgi:hypothetical protein